MAVRIVHIHVKPEHLEEFLDMTRRNHEGSIREPGNVRFDVLRSMDDPTRFVLYEWYATDEAAAAHRETPHYQAWVARAGEWLVEPRHADAYEVVLPEI
ncbi:MAG: antibiotic biosynthesis monooxygenase [Chloroflexi bacterium]|nr:antibiotic biosynthesis monooxygenase [Chloroflexota bacterium]